MLRLRKIAGIASLAVALGTAVAQTSDPALQPYQDAGGAVGAQAGSNYDTTDSYNMTKDVSGLVSADTAGSYGQTGESTVIRRSEGKLRCENGKDNYVAGLVVKVDSCNKSLIGSIVSMDVSICTKTQRGQRCDDPSEFTEFGTIDAVVGADSYVGIVTFNLLEPCDVERSSCKFEIRQTGVKDIDVNQMNEDAAAIIAADGEAGLAHAISDSVMGIGFADGQGIGADIANCFEAQNNELLDEGTITSCNGSTSADFGQIQDCTPVVPWTESCQADLPSHVVHCQAGELTCHREHPYDEVTCSKTLVTELVEHCEIPTFELGGNWGRVVIDQYTDDIAYGYGIWGQGAGGVVWGQATLNIADVTMIDSLELTMQYSDDWIAIYINDKLVSAGHCAGEWVNSEFITYAHADLPCPIEVGRAPEVYSSAGVSDWMSGIPYIVGPVIGEDARTVTECSSYDGDGFCIGYTTGTKTLKKVLGLETSHVTIIYPRIELKDYLVEGNNVIKIAGQTVDSGGAGVMFRFRHHCPQLPEYYWDDRCTDVDAKTLDDSTFAQ